jgi:hypothetical protein
MTLQRKNIGGFHLSRGTTVSVSRFTVARKPVISLSATFDTSRYRPFPEHQLCTINLDITNIFVRNSRQESAYADTTHLVKGMAVQQLRRIVVLPLVRKAA